MIEIGKNCRIDLEKSIEREILVLLDTRNSLQLPRMMKLQSDKIFEKRPDPFQNGHFLLLAGCQVRSNTELLDSLRATCPVGVI